MEEVEPGLGPQLHLFPWGHYGMSEPQVPYTTHSKGPQWDFMTLMYEILMSSCLTFLTLGLWEQSVPFRIPAWSRLDSTSWFRNKLLDKGWRE